MGDTIVVIIERGKSFGRRVGTRYTLSLCVVVAVVVVVAEGRGSSTDNSSNMAINLFFNSLWYV